MLCILCEPRYLLQVKSKKSMRFRTHPEHLPPRGSRFGHVILCPAENDSEMKVLLFRIVFSAFEQDSDFFGFLGIFFHQPNDVLKLEAF